MPSWTARSAFTGIEDDVSNAFEPWIGTEIGRGNRATGMKTTLQNEGFFSWENEWLEEDDTFPECKMGDPFFGGGVNFRGVCLYFFKEVVSVSMSN